MLLASRPFIGGTSPALLSAPLVPLGWVPLHNLTGYGIDTGSCRAWLLLCWKFPWTVPSPPS